MRKFCVYLVVLVLFLLSGCTINNVIFSEEQASGTLQSSELLSGEIVVENRNGSVKVEKWDEDYVKVEYEKKVNSFIEADLKNYLDKTTVELINAENSVTIKTSLPRITNGGVSVSIKIYVPKNVHLDITTTNGSITVNSGIVGDVKLKSSNGGININGLTGKLDLDTSNGSIKLSEIEGSGSVNTSNGSIYFDSSLEVGDITLNTSNGKIDVDLQNPVGDKYKLKTSNGNITVKIPADIGFHLDASTTNGTIKSNLDGISGRNVEEEINGGGFRLDMETTNGTININSK